MLGDRETNEVVLVRRSVEEQRRMLVKQMADVDLSRVDPKHPIDYDRVLTWIITAKLIEQGEG